MSELMSELQHTLIVNQFLLNRIVGLRLGVIFHRIQRVLLFCLSFLWALYFSLHSGYRAFLKRHSGERYRPPIPPQATREMKVHCERKTTMPKMRDRGGIGGQVLNAVFPRGKQRHLGNSAFGFFFFKFSSARIIVFSRVLPQ